MVGRTVAVHDWRDEEKVSESVVEAVTERAECDVTAVGPLYEVLDPAALDALFRPSNRGSLRDEGHVTFPIGAYEVTVHANGRIVVEERG